VGRFVDRDFLADGGRGQVDDQALAGIGQAGVFDGGVHALARFFNGAVGQPMIVIPGKPLVVSTSTSTTTPSRLLLPIITPVR
jgi:hypothetical protein